MFETLAKASLCSHAGISSPVKIRLTGSQQTLSNFLTTSTEGRLYDMLNWGKGGVKGKAFHSTSCLKKLSREATTFLAVVLN